jgi:hypothetical protein
MKHGFEAEEALEDYDRAYQLTIDGNSRCLFSGAAGTNPL